MIPPKMLPNIPGLSMPPRPSFGKPKEQSVSIEIEAEGPEAEESGDEQGAMDAAGYVKPDQRCGTCMHHDGGKCQLFDFACEAEGGCPEHEMREGTEVSPVPPMAEAEPAEE